MTVARPSEANGPNGYPVPGTNPTWDAAVRSVLFRTELPRRRAEAFLVELGRALKERSDGVDTGT